MSNHQSSFIGIVALIAVCIPGIVLYRRVNNWPETSSRNLTLTIIALTCLAICWTVIDRLIINLPESNGWGMMP